MTYVLSIYSDDLLGELKEREIKEVRVAKKISNMVVEEGLYINMQAVATALDTKNDVKIVCVFAARSEPVAARKELNKWINEKIEEFEKKYSEEGIAVKRGEWQ